MRYDYAGPGHSDYPNLSIFDPTSVSGLVVAGQGVPIIYLKFWGGVSPRIGFSYQVDSTGDTVLHVGYGYYYDAIYMKSILQNNGSQIISVFGQGLNPAGSDQSQTRTDSSRVWISIPRLLKRAAVLLPSTRTSSPVLSNYGT
jgi:hypothetical protein